MCKIMKLWWCMGWLRVAHWSQIVGKLLVKIQSFLLFGYREMGMTLHASIGSVCRNLPKGSKQEKREQDVKIIIAF